MMVTVSEFEAVIAQTPSGEQVQFDTKIIGSVDHVTRKLTELKLNQVVCSRNRSCGQLIKTG